MGAILVLLAVSGDFVNLPCLLAWRTPAIAISTPTKTWVPDVRGESRDTKWIPARTSMAWVLPAAQSAHEPSQASCLAGRSE